ncbi:MAG: hypothetical protein Q9208_006811 [Pyrenodesmia sp. 3 TL-2023]
MSENRAPVAPASHGPSPQPAIGPLSSITIHKMYQAIRHRLPFPFGGREYPSDSEYLLSMVKGLHQRKSMNKGTTVEGLGFTLLDCKESDEVLFRRNTQFFRDLLAEVSLLGVLKAKSATKLDRNMIHVSSQRGWRCTGQLKTPNPIKRQCLAHSQFDALAVWRTIQLELQHARQFLGRDAEPDEVIANPLKLGLASNASLFLRMLRALGIWVHQTIPMPTGNTLVDENAYAWGPAQIKEMAALQAAFGEEELPGLLFWQNLRGLQMSNRRLDISEALELTRVGLDAPHRVAVACGSATGRRSAGYQEKIKSRASRASMRCTKTP